MDFELLILSAGKGTRLLPLTRNTPKCLIEIGNGNTVLEHQIKTAIQVGIEKIILVTGYLSNQVEAKIENYKKQIDIEVVYNPFYDTSNNLISFWLGLKHVNDDFAVLNGDNLVSPKVFTELNDASNKINLVIDRKEEYDMDDMKIILNSDQIQRVSKKIDLDEADGESIGFIRFRDGGANIIKEITDEIVRQDRAKDIFYLEVINELAEKGIAVNFVEVPEDQWTEMDFHADLEFLRDNLEKYGKKVLTW